MTVPADPVRCAENDAFSTAAGLRPQGDVKASKVAQAHAALTP